MEGELTSADYRKLQSLVDEQEKAVEAGESLFIGPDLKCRATTAVEALMDSQLYRHHCCGQIVQGQSHNSGVINQISTW